MLEAKSLEKDLLGIYLKSFQSIGDYKQTESRILREKDTKDTEEEPWLPRAAMGQVWKPWTGWGLEHLGTKPLKGKATSVIIQPAEFHVNNLVTPKDIFIKTTFIQP